MISEGWKQLKAREVFDSVSKKNHPDEELLSATQDMGVVPRSMLSARVTMPTKNIETFKLVEKGDFVISLRSFQGGIEYSQYRGIVSPAYTVLKNKVEICSEFFKYYFKTNKFINNLDSSVIGIRDGKQISYKDFAEIYLPYPPLPEQRKIAAILSSVDDTIQATQAVIDQTLRVKQGLLQQLLTRGIGHTKFKKTELGEIPEEWRVIGISNIASKEKNSFKRGPFGGSLKKEIFVPSGYKVYEQKNAIYNNFKIGNYFITKEKYEEMKDFSIKKDDIIISCSGTLGKVAVVPNSFNEGIINQALLKITIDQNKYSVVFMKYLLESDYVQSKLVDTSLGSAMKNMASMKIIKNTKICVPPLSEQQKIASILSKVNSQIQNNLNYLARLQELKKGLIQDLLNGFVRVRLDEEV